MSEKLAELSLDSLEERRRQIDLAQTFKLVKGMEDVPLRDASQFSKRTGDMALGVQLVASHWPQTGQD